MGAKLKELWECPKCGETFITKNLWHSCGKFSLEELFSRSEPHVLELFNKFAELVQACGPVTIIPQRTRVAFQVRVRFAGAVPRKWHLQCGFLFTRRREHPRFYQIEEFTPRSFGHRVRISSEEELDAEFIEWIREAYEYGEQRHLMKG